MTFTDEDLQRIHRESTGSPSTAKPGAFTDNDLLRIHNEVKVSNSLSANPDRSARVQSVESEFGVPRDIADKHLDTLEAKRRPDVSGIFEDAPVTARHLSNPDYAALVRDELDSQRALERAARGYWENVGRGVLERTAQLTGNLIEAGGRVLNRQGVDALTPFLGVGQGPNPIGTTITEVGKAISEGASVYDYQAQFDWERLKSDVSVENLAGYVGEQGIKSLPDMAAAMYALPAYVASRTEELAEDRATNKGLSDPTMQEMVETAPVAVLSSLLERLGANAIFDLAAVETYRQAAKAAGQAAIKEGGTEFIQEALDYAAVTVGTDESFDPYEAIDRGLAGMVAGSGMGGTIRGATANAQAALNQYRRSMSEQDIIDKFNGVADGKLRDRSIEKLKAYAEDVAQSYGIGSVRIDGQVFNQSKELHKEFPSLMKYSPAEDGDVQLSMADYVALPKEIRAEIRPHVRLQADSLSQIEAETWQQQQEETLERIVKQAKVKAANYERAQQLYKSIADQIASTGVYSRRNSELMASVTSTYMAVKAEREGMSVDDVFSQMFLEVERDDGSRTDELTRREERGNSLYQKNYRGEHNPPGPEDGAPAWDLTGGGKVYPADVYSMGRRYYGTGDDKSDAESFGVAYRVRNNPMAKVRVYRAIPKDVTARKLNSGDWVSLSRSYANSHGESSLNGEYKIISQVVRAGEIYTNGDSINEFGFHPTDWKELKALQLKIREVAGKTYNQSIPDTIEIDGVQRPTKNSKGQMIHPTEEGVKNFWKWFKDSAVVDAEGRPLVAHHGTSKDFEVYDPARSNDIGIHFGTAQQADRASQVMGEHLDGARIAPSYLTIQNPLLVGDIFSRGGSGSYTRAAKSLLATKGMEDVDPSFARAILERAPKAQREKKQEEDDSAGDIARKDYWDMMKMAVESQGFDGFVYENKVEGKGKSYVVFGPKQIKSATGNTGEFNPDDPSILRQNDSRASIEILHNKAIIRLKESSDLSSFFHESGHYFLEMERKFASGPNATDRQKKDFQLILDYIGAPDGNIQTEHHEKFARAFENYIGEGRAPSVDLKAIFRRFAQWIIGVYKTLRNLDAELTPEIREVFDRMLATDEQIERAHQKFWYELVEDKPAKAIADKTLDAKDRATERLRSRLIKELKARKEKEWQEERKTVVDELKAKIAEEPRYKTATWLKDNPVSREHALEAIGDTSPKLPKVLAWVKENDLTVEDINELRSKGSADLKKQKLIQWMKDNDVSPEELVRALDPSIQKQRQRLSGLTAKDGLPLDDAAELTGYSSGKEMLLDIVKNPTLAQEAGIRADKEMLNRHGDILNDGSLEKMADEIMHSEEEAKALLAQLKALRPTARLDGEAIKQEAKEIIGRLPANKVNPDGYYRAEVKHARAYEKSLAEGDIAMAGFHAQQRLVQFHLAREATTVKSRVDRHRKALKGWSSRTYAATAVSPEYGQNLRVYASLWDFRKDHKEDHQVARQRLEAVANWLRAQQSDANEFLKPQILDSIMARFIEGQKEGKPISIPSYETMTVDELQGVYDMASHLRHMGGQMSKEAALRRKAQAEEVVQSIEANSNAVYEVKEIQGLKVDGVQSFGRRFFADHIYLRRKLEQMDGNKDGILKKLIWEPIVAASNKKYDMRMESAKELREILAPIDSSLLGRGKGKATVQKEKGGTWTLGTRERIMLALYWGNDYSRKAIMDGHSVTESDAMAMLSNLSRAELDVVEKLWKFNDKYWPEFSAVNTRMFGTTPPKVEPSPYMINGRKMTGGYMSISYRHGAKAAARGKDVFDDAAQKIATGSHAIAQSQSGAAIARVGSGGQMVSLELQNIATAAEEAITTIAFSEVSREIGQIITNESVVEAIQKKHSPEVYQSLRDNIVSIVRGDIAPSSDLMKAMRWMRMNLTYALLGYSFRNFIQQPTSFFNVIGKVGEVEAVSALLDFYHHPFKYAEEIKSKSAFMRNRTAYINRETAEVTSEIGTGKVGFIKRYALAHQTLGDSLIAFAAWKAGYKEGLAKYGDEAKAIAHADDIVASTIGSGMAKDMSPMLHGTGILGSANGSNEIAKQFTFMGSFFTFTFNLVAESAQKSKGKGVAGKAQAAREMFWYLVPPAIVGKLLVSSLPGEDDDEAWWQWALKSVAEYGLGTVFFLRDIVSISKGFDPSIPYQSSVMQLGGMLKEMSEVILKEDDEFEWSDGKKMMQGLQPILPLPGSGQVLRTADYLHSYEEGDEGDLSPYDALVEGRERNQ